MSRFPFLFAMLSSPLPALAQSDGNAPLVLELPAGTRALAMGNVFYLTGGNPEAIFYAPAALNNARGASISAQRYRSTSMLGSLASAREWAGGGLVIGVQVLSYGTASSAFDQIPDDAEALLSTGAVAVSEAVGSIGYGRVVAGLRVGLVAKVIEQRLGGARDGTGAIDLGVAKAFGRVTLGLTGQNLGPDLTLDGTPLPLPYRVTAGASLRTMVVGPLDLSAVSAVSRLRDGDVVPAGGIELSYWPVVGRTFTGRVGVRRVPDGSASPITFGAAFTGDAITIEYAFEGFDVAGSAHRFGVRWR